MLINLQRHYHSIAQSQYSWLEGGTGHTVAILPGFPDSAATIAAAVGKQLDLNSRSLILDLLGSGDSKSTQTDFSLEQLSAELLSLLKHWSESAGEKITVVAHDWGGVLFLNIAAQTEAWVDKAILFNTAHAPLLKQIYVTVPAQQKKLGYVKYLASAQAVDFCLNDNGAFFRAGYAGTELAPGYFAALREEVSDRTRLAAKTSYYQIFDAYLKAESTPSPVAIPRFPLHIIFGQQDRALSVENAERLHELAKNSTLLIIPEANHWTLHTHSHLIAKYLE